MPIILFLIYNFVIFQNTSLSIFSVVGEINSELLKSFVKVFL